MIFPRQGNLVTPASEAEIAAFAGSGAGGGGSGPANRVFSSAWNFGGTGTSVNATTDVGNPLLPFDSLTFSGTNGSTVLNVIAGNALPNSRPAPPDGITNVLQVKRHADNNNSRVNVGTTDGVADNPPNAPHWADLALGEIFCYRIYTMMDVPNAEGDKFIDSNHFLQIPHDQVHPLAWKNNSPRANGNQTLLWQMTADGTGDNGGQFVLGAFNGTTQMGDELAKFVWYRWELGIRRDSAGGGYSCFARCYNASGTLLYSDDGIGASLGAFNNNVGSSWVTMASLAGSFAAPAVNEIRSFGLGTNGGTITYTQDVFYYWAALCICKGPFAQTWPIGAYNSSTGI